MTKRLFSVLLILSLALFLAGRAFSLEKIKFGTAVKLSAPNYLIVMAAEEKGFWQQNGLEAEWISFRGGGPFMQALASGALKVGVTGALTGFETTARGVPIIIISDWSRLPFSFWVKADSRLKEPQDLVGSRIGVTSLAGLVYSYALSVVKSLGIEKEVKFLGVGDVTTAIAALKTGSVDVIGYSPEQMAGLWAKAEVRELVSFSGYMPKEWADLVIMARKDLVGKEPQTAARAVKASLQAAEFVRNNPAWALDTVKSLTGFSEDAARRVYDFIRPRLATDGRLDRRALENVRSFGIEYGLLAKEKALSVDEIYTDQFVK